MLNLRDVDIFASVVVSCRASLCHFTVANSVAFAHAGFRKRNRTLKSRIGAFTLRPGNTRLDGRTQARPNIRAIQTGG